MLNYISIDAITIISNHSDIKLKTDIEYYSSSYMEMKSGNLKGIQYEGPVISALLYQNRVGLAPHLCRGTTIHNIQIFFFSLSQQGYHIILPNLQEIRFFCVGTLRATCPTCISSKQVALMEREETRAEKARAIARD